MNNTTDRPVIDVSPFAQAARSLGQHPEMAKAVLLVVYERERPVLVRGKWTPGVWRIAPVNRVTPRGQLVGETPVQANRDVVDHMVTILREKRGPDRFPTWFNLSAVLRQRLLDSSVLPMEFKSLDHWNDRAMHDAPIKVIAPRAVITLLS